MAAPTKAPEDMTDEELDEAIKNPPADLVKEVLAPDDAEAPDEEAKGDQPEEDEPKEDEPKPPSRREQLRIQQLLEKYKDKPEDKKPPQAPDALNYNELLDADPELIKKLEADRQRSNEAFYNQGREQTKSLQFHTRLEIDAPRVEAKYTFLDPRSSDFNERAALAMNNKYLQFVGFDGNNDTVQRADIRYADFVEAEMEFATEVASHQVADAKDNLRRQAARTGLRPGGGTGKKLDLTKAPEDMSDEELDAYIAKTIPQTPSRKR